MICEHLSSTPLRCHTLDAFTVDKELNQTFHSCWSRICSYLGARLQTEIMPETEALLHATLWYLSIGSGKSTPGQSMQNISYIGHASTLAESERKGAALEPHSELITQLSRKQKLGTFALTVVLPWLYARVTRLLNAADHQRLWRMLHRAQAASKLLALMCTLRFLWTGRHQNVAMLLLGMHFAYKSQHQPRYADFDFLKQELSWHAFAELMLSIRLLFWHEQQPSSSIPRASAHSNSHAASSWLSSIFQFLGRGSSLHRRQLLEQTPLDTCSFCYSSPMHTPRVAACGHKFCYYCLATACLQQSTPRCPQCAQLLFMRHDALVESGLSASRGHQ